MASSEPEGLADSSETTGAVSTPAMDAKARREARKARILSSGTDRLARITKTGRGGEAELLYSEPVKSPASRSAASPSSSSQLHASDDNLMGQDEEVMLKRAQAAMQGGVLGSSDDDPGEVDISQGNSSAGNNPFLMGQMHGQQGGPQGMPQDMQGMIQMMQSAMMGGAGAPPPPGAGPGANAQSPFPFPFPSAGSEPAVQPPSSKPNVLDTLFNLLRIAVFAIFGLALVYGALGGRSAPQLSVTEDEDSVVDKFEQMTTLHRWARLAYEKPAHWEARYFGVESFGLPIHGIPVFWIFITLEIALQSSRIMLQRSRPPPPGFLLKASAYIPNAHIRLLIRTLASYLPLLDAFVNDLAIVVFTIGCTIIFAAWKVGLDPILAASDGTLGANMGLQSGALGSAAGGSVAEKMMEMNNPVMSDLPHVQAAL